MIYLIGSLRSQVFNHFVLYVGLCSSGNVIDYSAGDTTIDPAVGSYVFYRKSHCSLRPGPRLHILTAVPGATQPSTLCGL